MKIFKIYKYVLAVAALLPLSAVSQTDKYAKYHEEIGEMSIEQNLNSPDVPTKNSDGARNVMATLAGQMQKAGLATDLSERGGMVLMVTVPTEKLFAANDTLLLPAANDIMTQIMQPLRVPDRYKLLIAVHSDNTGSEDYLTWLTQTRADAILSWIDAKGIPTEGIVTYGMGNDEPLVPDTSRAGRQTNRRVEFYYVPGPVMIQELKAKR